VIWAHHILGLTVNVSSGSRLVALFGGGPVRVAVEVLANTSTDEDELPYRSQASVRDECVVLFFAGDTTDVWSEIRFSVHSDPMESSLLEPSHRHALLACGTKLLFLNGVTEVELQLGLVKLVLALCIASRRRLAAAESGFPTKDFIDMRMSHVSEEKLLSVGKDFFDGIALPTKIIVSLAGRENILDITWQDNNLPPSLLVLLTRELFISPERNKRETYNAHGDPSKERAPSAPAAFLYRVVISLSCAVLDLATIHNVDDCTMMPIAIDSLQRQIGWWYESSVTVLTANRSWFPFSILLGHESRGKDLAEMAVVVSSSGWSMVLEPVEPLNPNSIPRTTAYAGVPSLYDERRSMVADTNSKNDVLASDDGAGVFTIKRTAGEKFSGKRSVRARLLRPKIAVTPSTFEIIQDLEIRHSENGEIIAHVRTGPYAMHELRRHINLLSECCHAAEERTAKLLTIPVDCVEFSGLWPTLSGLWPPGENPKNSKDAALWGCGCRVHIAIGGKIGKETADQWGLLLSILGWQPHSPKVYMMDSTCCLECAVLKIRKISMRSPNVLLIARS
jgi:hypothetical protein